MENITEPLRYRIAQKQYVEDLENLAFTVTQSFFDLLLAKINVEVAEFNVTVNDSILQHITRTFSGVIIASRTHKVKS